MTNTTNKPRRKVSADELLRRFGKLEIELDEFRGFEKRGRVLSFRWHPTGDPQGEGTKLHEFDTSFGIERHVTIHAARQADPRLVLHELNYAMHCLVTKAIETFSAEQTTFGQLLIGLARSGFPGPEGDDI